MEPAAFFFAAPLAGQLYDALAEAVRLRHPTMIECVKKTQVTFCDPNPFVWCWLPGHSARPRPDGPLLVSFGFGQRIDDPRILQAVEPYPNRWTHHVAVSRVEEIDEQLLTWLDLSHLFRCAKKPRARR